jgi:hypothetical protein
MWPLPREFLFAVIAGLAIALIAVWPSHQDLIDRGLGVRTEPQTLLQTSNQTEKSNSLRMGEAENAHEFLGIKPGEWFLGVVTLMLWVATTNLVKEAKSTSERQLRAYVYLEIANFKYTTTGDWEIKFRFKNFGRTPAHNVVLTSILKVVDWNGDDTEIPIPKRKEHLGSMAPRGDFYDFQDELEGTATLAEIKTGSKAIFLVGTIQYDIVYEPHGRITNFRYLIGGDMGGDGDEMYADDDGNDST